MISIALELRRSNMNSGANVRIRARLAHAQPIAPPPTVLSVMMSAMPPSARWLNRARGRTFLSWAAVLRPYKKMAALNAEINATASMTNAMRALR